MSKIHCALVAVAVVLLASCVARTGMPEFSVFDKSAMNEAVQVSSDALIEDVSVVRLDASEGAPILGVIEWSTGMPRTEVSSCVSAPRAAVPVSI